MKSGLLIKKIIASIFRVLYSNKPLNAKHLKNVKKILLYRCDAIGDYVVTTPSIKLLSEKLPDAEIHMILSPRNCLIAKNNPHISKFHLYDKKFLTFLKLYSELRREHFDVLFAFDLFKTTKAGNLLNLLTGKRTVKSTFLHKHKHHEHSAFFNILFPAERNQKSMVEMQADMIAHTLGFSYDSSELEFELPVGQEADDFAENFIRTNHLTRFSVFNITAGRDHNMWSLEKNSEFLSAFKERFKDEKIVIIASPADKELAEKLTLLDDNFRLFPTEADICKVTALIGFSDIVISPDTAIVHIAAAKGKPVLGFYSTKTAFLKEWEPFGVTSRIIVAPHDATIEAIDINEALDKFSELISS